MSAEAQAQRVRTVSQAMESFKTSKEFYEALIKQPPDFTGKLRFQTLYAPKEYIIRTQASEIPSLLKAISGLGQKAVHLEGPSLSVRNVPTNVSPSKIQITLQTELPQIVFLDLFPPNQQGALHRGVGKLYLEPEAWTEDAHADFHISVPCMCENGQSGRDVHELNRLPSHSHRKTAHLVVADLSRLASHQTSSSFNRKRRTLRPQAPTNLNS